MTSAAPVGPVLRRGALADTLVDVLRAGNPQVQVVDRGAYLRVSAPSSLRLLRRDVELALGRPFLLPGDLERVMTSFAGRLRIGEDEVLWRSE